MAKKILAKAQTGKTVTDPKKYLEESRKKTKAVTDSARTSELNQGIKTYSDYLNKQIAKGKKKK
jgi:hypothetical protein